MAGNKKGSESYFGEMRTGYSNPNFFNNIALDVIRRNVKRIVKDIKYDNISDMDYIYFNNERVMSACLEESYNQMRIAHTLNNALHVYLNSFLVHGMGAYPNMDINEEIASISRIKPIQDARHMIWCDIYNRFNYIRNNNITDIGEIKAILSPIREITTAQINIL